MKFYVIAILFTFLMSACATRVQLTPTDRVPAAQGEMTLDSDENSNTTIKMELQHLAPPNKLRGDLTVYVVWARDAASDGWKNIGQLQIDDERSGSGKFTVPYHEFDVQVTAEANGEAATPTEFVVFEGQAKN